MRTRWTGLKEKAMEARPVRREIGTENTELKWSVPELEICILQHIPVCQPVATGPLANIPPSIPTVASQLPPSHFASSGLSS